MKTTLITLFTIVILFIGALIVGPSFVDWSHYKGQAQEQIKTYTGYDTKISGDLSLALIPAPRLRVEGVTVTAGREELLALERLDVNLELLPLLSSKIVVKAVELIEPDVRISVLSNGTQNWQTPQVNALLSGGEQKKPAGGNELAQNVSLQNIMIKNGQFSYVSAAGKAPIVLEDINAKIEADTLKGPFNIVSDLSFAGKPLEIEANIGALKTGAESLTVKAQGDYAGLEFSYGGAVGLKAPFESQGEITLEVANLSEYLNSPTLGSEPFSFKGLVTGSAEKVAVKAARIQTLGQNFVSDIDVALNPLSVTMDLAGQDTFNLDQLLLQSDAQKDNTQSGGDITQLSNILPQTLELPAGFELRLNASIPAAIYNGQAYKEIAATLTRQGQSLKANMKAKVPGGADVNIRSDLSFASKSTAEKTGSEILAEPVLNLQTKISAPNIAATAAAFTGKENLPLVSTAKTGAFDIAALVQPGLITLQPSTVRLDSQSYKLSGSLKGKTVVANIDAYGGQLIVKGDINADMQLRNMAVQVKHPSLPKAVQTLTGDKSSNPFLVGPVDFYTKLQQEGSTYTLSDIKAKVLNSYVTGGVKFDGGGKVPVVSGSLAFENLVIPASKTSPAAKGKAGGGQWSSAAIDTGFLHAANVDLAISANSIKYGKWDIAKPNLAFKLAGGALSISELKAGLFGGQLAMNADVKGPKGGALSVTSNAQMSGVQIERLVDALVGSELIKGRGVVNLDTQIATSGTSQAALIKALSGQGAVTGVDIVLEGFDANRFARALSEEAKAGDSLLHLWKGTTSGGSSAFDTLDGAYTISEGIVSMSKMDLDGPTTAIATKGTVNLPAWRLNSAHTISVKDRDDVPPFTIELEGPLNSPAQTFAQGAIQDYLGRKIQRKLDKMLQDKIGDKLGGSDNPLNQILGGVLGGGTNTPANDNQPSNTKPAGGEQQQPAQEKPAEEPLQPEELLNDVLKGLF